MYHAFIASLGNNLQALVRDLASVTELSVLVAWQKDCREYCEPPIIARQQDLLIKWLFEQTAFAPLVERYDLSDAVEQQLVIARYEELLTKVIDLYVLEELSQDCPEPCNQLIIARYKELLASSNSLKELEEAWDDCMGLFLYLLLDRYQELLTTVNNLVELEKLFDECPEPFEPAITLRYQEVLSLWLPRQEQLNSIKERYIKCPDDLQHLFFIKECWGFQGMKNFSIDHAHH